MLRKLKWQDYRDITGNYIRSWVSGNSCYCINVDSYRITYSSPNEPLVTETCKDLDSCISWCQNDFNERITSSLENSFNNLKNRIIITENFCYKILTNPNESPLVKEVAEKIIAIIDGE